MLHLQDEAHLIPPINFNAKTLLLLGRDIISVHYVQDQRIGGSNSPYGQKISLGWVIVGETCIGRAHKSSQVNVNQTAIFSSKQGTTTNQGNQLKTDNLKQSWKQDW